MALSHHEVASPASQLSKPRQRGSLLLSALLSTLLSPSSACYLQGVDSGVCRQPSEVVDQMPFCGPLIQFPVCVPRYTEWYPNLTITAKDDFLRSHYIELVTERLNQEQGFVTFGDPNFYNYLQKEPTEHYVKNDDCQRAFKNFLCWMNFPRCDAAGESLMLCRSVCENFFRTCRFPRDIWRCYNPEFYGGLKPEGTDGDQELNKDGNPIFLRALLPGIPFTGEGEERREAGSEQRRGEGKGEWLLLFLLLITAPCCSCSSSSLLQATSMWMGRRARTL